MNGKIGTFLIILSVLMLTSALRVGHLKGTGDKILTNKNLPKPSDNSTVEE